MGRNFSRGKKSWQKYSRTFSVGKNVGKNVRTFFPLEKVFVTIAGQMFPLKKSWEKYSRTFSR
jgi:hypothetical protein